MKNSIKAAALFILLSTGILATAEAKTTTEPAKGTDDITLSAMQEDRGVAVNILRAEPGKSMVKVYDNANHTLLTDFLPNKPEVTKGYVLTDLENGDYTIEVTSDNQVVKKAVHVYEDGSKKAFFFVAE